MPAMPMVSPVVEATILPPDPDSGTQLRGWAQSSAYSSELYVNRRRSGGYR